ncbi:MAG TPA: membrane lipoprotein lipid attachment site-containing protein [Bacilli bacterium]|nr:membrane lipoprotein lipid attachment site-containing protein [Bacilli bacterium]
MKKMIFFILASLLLTGCKCSFLEQEVIAHEGRLELKMPEEYYDYLDYNESDIPNFVWNFEGSINTAKTNLKSNEVMFHSNDDIKLSKLIKDLLDSYRENNRLTVLTVKEEKEHETFLNSQVNGKWEKVFFRPENQVMYNEVAYISLENGLKLSLDYRRFGAKDENDVIQTYYAWQYTQGIRMILHYPFQVIKKGEDKKLVLLSLYDQTKYTIGTHNSLKAILKDDKYLNDEGFRKFFYPEYDEKKGMTEEELAMNIQIVKDYYVNGFNGQDGSNFTFEYLGKKFEIKFTESCYFIKYLKDIE